jgi:hypothetical protein
MATKKRRRSAGKSRRKTHTSADASAGEIAGNSSASAGDSTGEASGHLGTVERPTVAAEVDAHALTLEADTILQNAPADTGPAPANSEPQATTQSAAQAPVNEVQIDPNQRAANVAPVASMLVYQAAVVFVPNWRISTQEAEAIGGPLALTLAHWMPDTNIDPKYMALLALASATWGVVSLRRNPETGEFMPARAQPAQRQAAPTPETKVEGQPLSI